MALDANPPKSAINEILWPSLASGSSASILSILFQLQQSEYWAPEQIAAGQAAQLHVLLRHCVATVPAYQDILKAIAYDGKARITGEQWHSLPILQRRQVAKLGSLLESTKPLESHGKVMEVHTAGTTDTPIRIKKTVVEQMFYMAFTLRDHFWHGRNFREKFAMIKAFGEGIATYPDGGHQENWGAPYRNLFETGESIGLTKAASTEQQVEWLQREQPAYLQSFPSVIEAIAHYCLEKNIALSFLKGVGTLGEPVNVDHRQLCKEAFGVKLVDMYSAQEVGYLALQCSDSEAYHVQSEGVFLEILDEENKPCTPGEVGRVVVTPLHNFAMPLLRYEIGDYAEVGKPCACGRGLPTLSRILGRSAT